eukprot:6198471-Pleurochrysis_carterae.AAC.1
MTVSLSLVRSLLLDVTASLSGVRARNPCPGTLGPIVLSPLLRVHILTITDMRTATPASCVFLCTRTETPVTNQFDKMHQDALVPIYQLIETMIFLVFSNYLPSYLMNATF